MIQANELRIGSWTQQEINGDILYDQLDKGKDLIDVSLFGDPIPLTPEILEKCGFEPTTDMPEEYFVRLTNGIDRLMVRKGKVAIVIFGGRVLTTWYKHITSLHQLQNLYFALTGTELTVNL